MIRTTGLVKRYGEHAALDGVDLEVPTGSVYGLVGPNGAGKTTLLAILAGLRPPSEGSVAVEADASRVAVLPDTPRFDEWLTGREVVALAAHLVGADPASVDGALADTGLADAADRRCGGYSRGMLQRLGIASTLVGSPRLLLLDEPASALDPEGRREVLDMIVRLRGTTTVVLSSHLLGDVQEVCDTVGVLDHGRLLFQGPLHDLLVGAAVPRYLVRFREDAAAHVDALLRAAWALDVEVLDGATLALTVTSVGEAESSLPATLAALGVPVVSFQPEAVDLERAFLELTR